MPETLNLTGTVNDILISKRKGDTMISVPKVEAVAGKGLVGDRNFSSGSGKSVDNHLTLIELEKIQQFVQATGLDFSPEDARRNVVTHGIELNPLVGQEFYVGPVKVKALELCEPCSLLARRTNRAVLWGLLHKGGLRCRIVTSGLIHVGDCLRPIQG